METIVRTETTNKWEELSESAKRSVIIAHARALKIRPGTEKMNTLRRVFELGRPFIVRGFHPDGETMYCRVHQDSADAMRVLTKNYL